MSRGLILVAQHVTDLENIKASLFFFFFSPCGASLATHEDGVCPGATKDPCAADKRLLESLLGRRKLSLMEKMGRIPFISI